MLKRLVYGLIGAFLGVLVGFGVMFWFWEYDPKILALVAAGCGIFGMIFGERFLDWLGKQVSEIWSWW